jgi:O-antigen ligase
MVIASRPLAAWFLVAGEASMGNEAGSVLDRWVLVGLAVPTIAILVRRNIDWGDCLRRHGWLMSLLAYMFLSTLWSQITLIAIRRCIREVIVVLMALALITEANPRQALESILRRTAYVLLPFSLVLIKYYPLLGVRYGKWSGALTWVGVTAQKNHLGRLCMISVLFLAFALYRRWRDRTSEGGRYVKWADISILLLAIYLLKGAENAYSATSLVTLALGLVTFLALHSARNVNLRLKQMVLLASVIVLFAFGVATPFLGGSGVAALTSSLGRDSTLTGRTEVWSDVLPEVEREPLLGHGFGSFWTDARRALYDIPTAHNGYLDILLELGVVGLGLYGFWLVSCTFTLCRALNRDYDWASMGISFLLMGLLYNTTESALNSLTEHMTAVTVLALFVASHQQIAATDRKPSVLEAFPQGYHWQSRSFGAQRRSYMSGTRPDSRKIMHFRSPA